jgi:hypothetical protein
MSRATRTAAPSSKISYATQVTYTVPWRERLNVQIKTAAEILGISQTSVYRLGAAGRLKLLRNAANRTVVEVKSLIALADNAEPWTASTRGAAGRAKQAANRAAKREG